uniref:Uncharacterized protein n=1 Tax=Cannabis sativa TaxID=3483 RepID=A0A803PA89_CANSA
MQTEPGLDKFVDNSSGVRESLVPLITWEVKIVPCQRHKDTPIFVLATAGLRRSWIRVLSGKEEAYYGWVALNYKMEISRNQSMSPTLELLDLGGSSLCFLDTKSCLRRRRKSMSIQVAYAKQERYYS